MGQKLRGWERFMEDLAEGGAFTEDLIQGMVEKHLKNLALYLEAVGDHVQIIQFGDDLGTQDRPQMSVECISDPSSLDISNFITSFMTIHNARCSCIPAAASLR